MRYDYAKLDNGLELVGEHMPDRLSMAAGYFCRTGARDEAAAESGVSHFLEHMMFKGTDTLSYDDINKTFDRIGAQYNAFTSEEFTVYFGQVLPDYQGELVTLLSRMMRPALRVEDFTMEKNVILEEIAMYEDMPLWVAHDKCRSLHYQGHPLANSVLGTTDSITALTRDQMADYFNRRYAPDNLTVGLSGNYDWQRACDQVAELTADWQPSGADRERAAVQAGQGLVVVPDDKFSQATFYILAPGPSAQEADRYTAAVLSAAIGSGPSSRLYQSLIVPGLADDAGLGHSEEDGAGQFAGTLVTEPDLAATAWRVYRGALLRVQEQGLEPTEVERAKRRFASGLVFQGETPLHRLIHVGVDWSYRRKVESIDAVIEALRAVTADDCNKLLAERRPFDTLSAVCVGPVESVEENNR